MVNRGRGRLLGGSVWVGLGSGVYGADQEQGLGKVSIRSLKGLAKVSIRVSAQEAVFVCVLIWPVFLCPSGGVNMLYSVF